MKTIILLEKRTYLVKLAELFKRKQELTIEEVKQKVPSTTYYRSLLFKLVNLNKTLKEGPGYFIKPVFVQQGKKVYTGLKKHPDVKVEISEGFVVLSYENK